MGLLSMSWPTKLSTSGKHPSQQHDISQWAFLCYWITHPQGASCQEVPYNPREQTCGGDASAGDASVQAQVHFEERQGDTEKQNPCRSDWNAPESSLQAVQSLNVRLEVILAHAQAKSLCLGNSQKATKERQRQIHTHLTHLLTNRQFFFFFNSLGH